MPLPEAGGLHQTGCVRPREPDVGARILRPMNVSPDPLKPLKNQKALVTGASSGIGEACALALGAAGADVVVNYVSDQKEAQRVVDRIQHEPRRRSAINVRPNASAIRHHRYPGEQRRASTRRSLSRDDSRAMEHGGLGKSYVYLDLFEFYSLDASSEGSGVAA